MENTNQYLFVTPLIFCLQKKAVKVVIADNRDDYRATTPLISPGL